MTEKKITYVDALNVAIAIEGLDKEVADKLVALKNSIEKKSANKKPSKAQAENVALCEKVVAVLATFPEGATATEIAKASDELKDFSNQKITGLLKILRDNGTVVRETVGRKSVFKLAVADAE